MLSLPLRVSRPLETSLLDRACGLLLIALPILFLIGQAAADIALSAIAVLFLARSLVTGAWAWLRTPWVALGLIVWAYLVANAAFVAADHMAAYSRALPFGRFVVFGAALQHWLLLEERVRRAFLAVLGAVVAFVTLDTLLQYVRGEDLFGRPYESFKRLANQFDRPVRGAFVRLTGPFDNTVPGAFLSRVSFPLVALLFAWSLHARRRLAAEALAVGATLLLALTIALTGERAALLMFGLGLVLLFFLLASARRSLLVAGLACALALGAVIAAKPDVSTRLVGHTSRDLSGFWDKRMGRLALRGVSVWQEAPVFGVGLKNFRQHCENQDFKARGRLEERCYTHPHYLYNEWLAETGLVGLVGFLALIALWGRDLGRGLMRADGYDYALGLGACIALVIFLWPLRPSMSFFTNWNGVLFWLMLGLGLAVLAPRPQPAAQSATAPS